jgi:predicted amidohydrolase YtcJ
LLALNLRYDEKTMNKKILLLILFAASFVPVSADSPLPIATRIFINGNVWTADPEKPHAEAIAIREDKILAVGSNQDVQAHRNENTEVIDLKGNFVSPGFNDAHLHFLVPDQVEIEESDSLDLIQKKITQYTKAHSGPWITGHGWGYASFPDKKPHRKYFDQVMADRPVLINERDGHMALANSKALELAGITKSTPDPEHGRIVHDENGDLTGELQESAIDLVEKFVPEPSQEDLYASLRKLLDRAASYGLTSVQNASFREQDLPVFDRVIAENALKVRFYWAIPFRANSTEKDLARYKTFSNKYQPHLMKFGGAKGMLDGVVDAQTAAMFEPYTTGKNGILMWKPEDLLRTAELYDREGFQILLHAIGDKAIDLALDAYEHVEKVNGKRDRRHRIEHIEVPRLQDLPRFKQLGVIASTQALFASPDKTTLENYVPLLGPERSSHANAFKLFDDAGAIQAFGSDWPVFSMESLKGVYAAVARRTPDGNPAKGHFPEHRISVEAALRHFTIDAAYASFDEDVKGSITAGKLADFVVLSENILQPPPEILLKARVLLTVMGGKDTYRVRDLL